MSRLLCGPTSLFRFSRHISRSRVFGYTYNRHIVGGLREEFLCLHLGLVTEWKNVYYWLKFYTTFLSLANTMVIFKKFMTILLLKFWDDSQHFLLNSYNFSLHIRLTCNVFTIKRDNLQVSGELLNYFTILSRSLFIIH